MVNSFARIWGYTVGIPAFDARFPYSVLLDPYFRNTII